MNRILEILRAVFIVPFCVSCGARICGHDVPLCEPCQKRYMTERGQGCSLCGFPAPVCRCGFQLKGKKLTVYHAALYNPKNPGVVGKIVFNAKQQNLRDNFDFIAAECVSVLKSRLNLSQGDFIVTWMPRRRKAIDKYGHDQSREMAKRIAGKLNITLVQTMKNKGDRVQKKLSGRMREENARKSYFPVKDPADKVNGKRVILVDDIFTTGASLKSGTRILLEAGAADVIPLTFAKNDRPFRRYNVKSIRKTDA